MQFEYQWNILSYLQISEYRMFLNAWEEDPHGVGPVVQEGDSCSIQITGQLVDVCLQLCKSWWMNQIHKPVIFLT